MYVIVVHENAKLHLRPLNNQAAVKYFPLHFVKLTIYCSLFMI